MVLLDIVAPILLMFGVKYGTSGNASLLVISATFCWGLENNCTRKISEKSTYQIVTIKGLCSGFGSLIVSLFIGETRFVFRFIPYALMLGFVVYGLSIFAYIRAQKTLGAAKTSSYYSLAPFIGVFLAFIILKKKFLFDI